MVLEDAVGQQVGKRHHARVRVLDAVRLNLVAQPESFEEKARDANQKQHQQRVEVAVDFDV